MLAARLYFLLALSTAGAVCAEAIAIYYANGKSAEITIEQLAAFDQEDYRTITPWLKGEHTFYGPRLSDVARALNLPLDRITLYAIDDYFVELSKQDIERFEPIIAIRMGDTPLSQTRYSPAWLMWPFYDEPSLQKDQYYIQAIWNLIEITEREQP